MVCIPFSLFPMILLQRAQAWVILNLGLKSKNRGLLRAWRMGWAWSLARRNKLGFRLL